MLTFKDTARRFHLQTRKWVLTKHQIYWHLDLGLPNLQNKELISFVYGIFYSNPNEQILFKKVLAHEVCLRLSL
jgi:hypothetical protein